MSKEQLGDHTVLPSTRHK